MRRQVRYVQRETSLEKVFVLAVSRVHIGYSIPPQADCGWIGAVGPGPSYGDTEWKGEKITPPVGYDAEFTNRNTTFMTYNLMHLANMLKAQGGYPAYGNSRKAWDNGLRWDFENPEYR